MRNCLMFLAFILLFVVSSNQVSSQTLTTVTYNSPGVFSWTAPTGVTTYTVEAWGGGGGGGGGKGGLLGGPNGGGGGGGAYSVGVQTLTPGTAYNIGVGAGGGGGSSNNNGTAGNDSYFKDLTTLKAVGGSFGVAGGAGGVGGTSGLSIGTTKYGGGNGSSGGGGGSSGGTAGNGGNGSGSSGGSVAGGGSGGGMNNVGSSPGGGGGGGSGGGLLSGGGSAGKDGGLGQVKISYLIPPTLVIGTNAAVIAANICPSTTTVPLHSFSITGTNNPGNITAITAYLSGTYIITDITNLKLWTTGTTSTFTAPTQLGTTQASPAGVSPSIRTVSFSGLTYAVGNATHYFWITMDVTALAALSRNITAVGTLPANITATPTPTSFSNMSGTQTLGVGATPSAPVATTPSAANIACTSFNATWNASAATSGYFLDVSTQAGAGAGPTSFNANILGSYTNVSVGNVLTYGVTGLAAGATYYYRVRADKCGSTSTNSNIVTVTTSAVPPNPGNPTTAGSCSPPSYVLTRSGAPGAGITWYWQETTPAGTSTALNSTSTYAATTTGTYYIRAVTTGGCWSAGSGSAAITVGSVTGGTIASNQSICGSTDPAAFTSTVDGTGTGLVYSWENDDNSAFSSPSTIGGASSSTYDPPVIVASTYYRRVATVGSCSAYSNTLEISVAPTPVITASADVTICSGSSTSLSASGGIAGTYSWLGITGLSNAAIYNPVASPTATTTYTVTAYGVSTEKVVNPGFESGNTGFSSQYTYTVGANSLLGEGKYSIVTGNASGVHAAFRGLPRSGTKQMVINGAPSPGANVYCQDFIVAPNSDYAFSTWVSTVHPGDGTLNGRAKLQFSINGVVIGVPFYSPAMPSYPTASGWAQFFATWNSGSSSSATICVVNLNVTANGNDFALDDMSFAPYCAGTDVVTVTVPEPVLSSTKTPAAVCSGIAFTYTATSTFPSPTFTWSRATVVGISNGASSGTGNINETLINTTSSPINVTYVYHTISQGCTGVAESVVVSIKPRPTLSSALTSTICSGATLSYQATSASSGATFAWARATVAGITETGTSGTGDVSEVLTNTTGVPINVTYSYTTTANSCISTAQNVVVTVKGSAKLSSSLAPTAICSATAFTYTATSSTAGATFAWSRAGIVGISQVLSSGTGNVNETLTNTTASAISVTYVYVTTANGCSSTENVVISVKPKPQLNSTLTGALCSGNTFVYNATSGTAGPPSFSWTRAGVAGLNAAVAGSGTGNISEILTITSGTSSLTATYVYTASLNGCTGASQNLLVTVNPVPALSSTLTPAGICSGSTFTYNATSATSGATFSWSRAAVIGITEAATAGTAGVSETLTNTTTAAINVTYSYITTVGSCSNTPQNVVVSVKPLPILSSTLTPTPICSGSTFTYNATSATAGATYAWSRATVAGITEVGSTGSSNPVSQVLTNTSSTTKDVTYVYTTTASGCSGASQNVLISVWPLPQGTFFGNTICNAGADVAQLTFSSTAGTAPFSLAYSDPTATPRTESPALSNTPFSANPNQTVPGTYVYTLTSITDVHSCVRSASITTPSATITVTSGTITANPATPASDTKCSGTTVSFNVVATGVTSYTWEVNTTGANGGTYDVNGAWTPITGLEAVPTYNGYSSATLVVSNATTAHDGYRYRAFLLPGCGTVNVYSNIARMTINALPVLSSNLAPSPATCSGVSVSYTPTSNTAGSTFTWTRAEVTGITPPTSSGTGAINEILTNSTPNPIQVTYVYSITNTVTTCSTVAQNVDIVINPAPVLSSTTGIVASMCSPATFTYSASSESIGATFAWTRATVAGITEAGTSGTGSVSETLTNTTTSAIDVTYVYTTTSNTCPGPDQNVIVTVKPNPGLNSSGVAAICSATTYTYSPSSATAAASFSWTRATTGGITETGTSGNGSISEVLTNTTGSPISVAYVYTTSAASCSGTPENVYVNVNPTPVLNPSAVQSVCSGTTNTYTAASATAGSTFAWTRATVVDITPAGTTGVGSAVETFTNTTNAPINVIYTYTTTANGCVGPAQNRVVTVSPIPALSSSLTPAAVCSETAIAFGYTATSDVAGATYAWTRAAIATINSNAPGSGTGNVSEVLRNTSTAAVTVRYVYTTTANGCSHSPQNVDVSVKPRPVLNSSATSTVCSGSASTYTATSATAASSFAWSRAAIAGITEGATSGTANPIGETLTNTTTSPINVQYIYVTTAASCGTTPPDTVVVTVNPKPVMTSGTEATICTGTSLATNGTLVFATDIASSFAWARANTASVGPAGPTSGSSNPVSEILTNTTAAPITTTYVVTPTSSPGGCEGNAQNVDVSVTPVPAQPNAINANPN